MQIACTWPMRFSCKLVGREDLHKDVASAQIQTPLCLFSCARKNSSGILVPRNVVAVDVDGIFGTTD